MGLLSEGAPLTWKETKAYSQKVREKGISQFIYIFHELKDRKTPCLMWGDEIEYMLVSMDEDNQKARVSLRGEQILAELDRVTTEQGRTEEYSWHPEFASYMVEGTPGTPYKGAMAYFNVVEANMRSRREAIRQALKPNESVLTLTSFPRLGCKDFCDPPAATTPSHGFMQSLYIPDRAANNSHPRFLSIAKNIRQRKGRKVYINLPIYRDVKTPDPFLEDFSECGTASEIAQALEISLPNHVYMDCMCYGMGCCCLQVTFQACNIEEAKSLYDQLAAICPIMLALSAASPIFKGYLTDRDCRWDVICGSVDDRTDEESGLKPLSPGSRRIRKSRYDVIDCYISPAGRPYNDIPVIYDRADYQRLRDAGVDELLAEHIAHLFIRDPVILYKEKVEQMDSESDHFENIQSTNWQTMRFKPPPPNTEIGWRVEFRPQEVQLTDFENAAYVVFVVLLTRTILSYNLNFLIPISKMETNMAEAQKRNAVLDGRFYFHSKNFSNDPDPMNPKMAGEDGVDDSQPCSGNGNRNDRDRLHLHHNGHDSARPLDQLISDDKVEDGKPTCDEWELMSINEIINGKDNFPGLVPLVKSFLNNMELDVNTRCTIHQYLKLIEKRASGELFTMAKWIRDFVTKHPTYQEDSRISELINYDLVLACDKMTKGQMACPLLLGDLISKSITQVPPYYNKAEQRLSNCDQASKTGGAV